MDKVMSEDCFADGEEGGYDAVVVGSGYGGSVAACRISLAGFKVCLMEKGKKWEAHDFPTNSWKVLSALRMENRNLGISFGPRDALFQVQVEGDSLVAMACGLGGGSLVNAGVMLRTPIRARRNPKWPKEWETDWEACEASASSMLRIQSIPTQFPNAKIMQELTSEENIHTSLDLSINFDVEEQPIISRSSNDNGSCLACGNCLTGCPYNAKNSTDKNYLASAIQAGCTIKIECQVLYVVKNLNDIYKDDESRSNTGRRRWLVFHNETDFVTADFVILSAGVFGTANILFQSQMRGLAVSERLGLGFSCNGNNVAYLAGSSAPLSGYGLGKNKLSTIPFEQRPGPSISSSYTSSLGFTVQPAVLSMAYPYILFKGITTYGWPSGYWFLHGIIDTLKHNLGLKNNQEIVLNAMGHDDSDGKLAFEKDSCRISFLPPHDPQLPRKIKAFQKLTRKLGGLLFMSRYRSTSVHLLGGCIASLEPSEGVCNSKGQVFDRKSSSGVHDGLYVCDASLIPCSIGINPCLTIATASEHVSRHLVQDMINYKHKGVLEKANSSKSGSVSTLKLDGSSNLEIIFNEIMRGRVNGMPCTAYLKMKMNITRSSLDDDDKRIMLMGKSHPLLRGIVGGYVECKSLETDKLYVVNGEVDLCKVDSRTPYTQYMHYRLILAPSSGSRYILEGMKVMNPYLLGLYGWKESTTMYVTLKKESKNGAREEMMNLKGTLHISMIELLKSMISMKGRGRCKVKFIWLLTQSLIRTYILQIPRCHQKGFAPLEFLEGPYLISTLHEIKTEDGFIISCRQWKCTEDKQRPEREKGRYSPVLLINGHSTESYCLPTEPHDLVRSLLEAGHETWLLQPRLHPSNSSTDFTIEDIGRFDIPCAINKIHEVHGTSSIKVHVIAHCVGGLAIHIALMGGYVSATKIASLSCTNSSMFFKLTPSSTIKMWFPLIPMSMRILGAKNILPLVKTIKCTSRQELLKSIARFIPRQERCTYDECEVFSGIFGNTFWHKNITPSLHHWMNKKSLPRLPMAAFPHLRKICKAGFIVDSKGENSYLIHPERMALPTLYISGGRTLLVTPKTSFLANNYMKLHQPSYRHERVVVDGFGHSDLLIGEESHTKVFPHLLLHIEMKEKGRDSEGSGKRMNCSKKALAWGDDPYEEGEQGPGSWISPVVTLWFLFLLLVMLIYSMYFGLF